MTDMTRKGLTLIASLHNGTDYKSVSKADLWEALKYARHIAKEVLVEEGRS